MPLSHLYGNMETDGRLCYVCFEDFVYTHGVCNKCYSTFLRVSAIPFESDWKLRESRAVSCGTSDAVLRKVQEDGNEEDRDCY